MFGWIWTPDGKLRVRMAYIELVQAEIDETLRQFPEAHPIDARTLIALEAMGHIWDFGTGQVEVIDHDLN